MSITSTKNGRKAFNFSDRNDVQLADMLREAVRMVRESASGRRSGYRMALCDEVSAECERRGLNTATIALTA